MPFKTIWEKSGVYWDFYGTVEADEIVDANRQFYSNLKADACIYQLCDFTRTEKLNITQKELTYISVSDVGASNSIEGLKVALAVSDPKIREWSEAYVSLCRKLASNWDIRIFDDIASARKWVESK